MSLSFYQVHFIQSKQCQKTLLERPVLSLRGSLCVGDTITGSRFTKKASQGLQRRGEGLEFEA